MWWWFLLVKDFISAVHKGGGAAQSSIVTEIWGGGQLGFDYQQEQGYFSLHYCIQTGFRDLPATYQMGMWVSFTGAKVARA
jgi:hypothetical protein